MPTQDSMPSARNINQLKNLTERLKKARSLVLVDYQGLSHGQLTDLRHQLKELKTDLMITKNTLLKLALDATGNTQQATRKMLTGPTAVLFIANNSLPPLKTLTQFASEFSFPQIKFGWLEGQLTDKERLLYLATLPSKEILQAQLIGSLKSPCQRLTLCLDLNLRKLTMILKTLKL